MHEKFASSIPGQGTYLGCKVDPWSRCIQEATDGCLSLTSMCLSVCLSLSSVNISLGEDWKSKIENRKYRGPISKFQKVIQPTPTSIFYCFFKCHIHFSFVFLQHTVLFNHPPPTQICILDRNQPQDMFIWHSNVYKSHSTMR